MAAEILEDAECTLVKIPHHGVGCTIDRSDQAAEEPIGRSREYYFRHWKLEHMQDRPKDHQLTDRWIPGTSGTWFPPGPKLWLHVRFSGGGGALKQGLKQILGNSTFKKAFLIILR